MSAHVDFKGMRGLLLACAAGFLTPLPAQAQGQFASVTRVVAIEYDAYGQVIKETVQPGEAQYRVVTDYERTVNPHGAVTKRTVTWVDPLDSLTKTRVESTTYDSRSRYPFTQTNAKNHTETRIHSEATGALLSLTGPNQLSTSWEYDSWGRVLREDRADGTATTTAYRACIDTCTGGAVSVRITQNWFGASQTTVPTEEFADTLGRVVLTRSWGFDGSAILAEKVYDANARVEKIARPRYAGSAAVWTLYDTRDPIGRVTQILSPNQTGSGHDTTGFAYNGLSLTTTNAKGQNRTELRNAIGKLKSVTDHDGKTTSYLYEAFGNLTRTTDPKGNQINIGYDKLGHKTSLTDPDLGHWTYLVDPLGQTRRQTDAKAQNTTFEFDELGRMTRRLEPDLDSRWDYDSAAHGVGKLAEAYTWAGGAKDYRRLHAYDSLGRPASVLTRLDADYSETTTYDGFARVATTTHQRNTQGGSGGPLNSYTRSYNARGHVYLLQRSDGSTTSTVWQGSLQDAEGRFTTEQLGNGLATTRVYNPYTGRLATIQTGAGGSHQNDSYGYDAIGNLTARSQLISTSGALLAESFTYDNLNRLETSTIGAVTRTTLYDETGNITSKTGVGTYAYPPQGAGSVRPHAVSTITGSVAGLSNPGFAYDANGNLTSGLARAYGWTGANLPGHIDKLSGATAVQRTAFLYGPEHQRVRQTVSPMSGGSPGAATTTIWYAGSVEKEIDTAANTTTIRTHMPMGLGFVQETISGTSVAVTASAPRAPRYFLKDHLGSTLAVTDQAQAVLQRLSYDAWGRRRNTDGSDDAGALWGTLKNNQDHSGYTGHEHLDQLALVHMNARMYDPLLGRHTSADPTVPDPEDTQALNRYSYVLNNALAFVDPTGLAANDPPKETIDKRPKWGGAAIGPPCSIAPRCDGVIEYPDQSAVAEMQAKTEAAAKGGGLIPKAPPGIGPVAPAPVSTESQLPEWLQSIVGAAVTVDNQLLTPLGAGIGMKVKIAAGGLAGLLKSEKIVDAGVDAAKGTLPSAGGVVRQFEQVGDKVYYRVFSGDANVGGWLTAVPPRSSAWAQEALALPLSNKATMIQEVLVPSGTLLQRSRAIPMPEWGRMRGGAEQFKLLDEIPLRNFGPGRPLP